MLIDETHRGPSWEGCTGTHSVYLMKAGRCHGSYFGGGGVDLSFDEDTNSGQ